MNRKTSLIELSAVAARRLGLSNPNSKEQEFHSIQSNSEQEQEQEEEEEETNQTEEEVEKPKQKKSRYFTNSLTNQSQTPNSKNSIHHLTLFNSNSKHKTNQQIKRTKIKSNFLDSDCISNWKPNWSDHHEPKNVIINKNNGNHQSIIIGIKLGESLVFRGTLLLNVLKGKIEINGARIEARKNHQSIEIFAPISHPLPILTTLQSTSSSTITQEIGLDETNFDAIIELQDFHTGIEGIDLVWSSNGTKRPIWYHSNSKQLSESSIYGITWDIILNLTNDVSSIKLPKTWYNSLSNQSNQINMINQNQCYLIQGSKGVGKSTFLRFLLNHLLQTFTKVAVLDLDPGQPLFNSPSLISLNLINHPLIGPSFCFQSKLKTSLKSIYLGNISPIDSPKRYIENCEELINFYKAEFIESFNEEPVLLTKRQRQRFQTKLKNQNELIEIDHEGKKSDKVPLLVNTMGWTTGLGSELLNQIRQLVNPTTIFTFENPETFQVNENEEEEKKVKIEYLEMIGDTPLSLRLPSNESRTLNLISYLYSIDSNDPIPIDDQSTKFFQKWDFETQLYKKNPIIINSDEIQIDLIEENIPNSHLSYVLNGSIVSIQTEFESNCIGIGLIRSFDSNQNLIYLILPESFENHQIENLKISKGFEPCLPLNVLVYEHQTFQFKPYLEIKNLGNKNLNSIELVGFEKKRIRRNVMRWSQRGNH